MNADFLRSNRKTGVLLSHYCVGGELRKDSLATDLVADVADGAFFIRYICYAKRSAANLAGG